MTQSEIRTIENAGRAAMAWASAQDAGSPAATTRLTLLALLSLSTILLLTLI